MFQNILIMLVGRQDTNNAAFLNVFLRIFLSRTKIRPSVFFMRTLAFSCRQASTMVISAATFIFLNTNWLDVYKHSVTSFCGMCCTEWWSPNLVKSSGWTSGGSTAYRLIGRVAGLCLVVKFRTVFWERSDCGQLSNSSSRQLVDQVACLCLGDEISEGQSSLLRQRCVGTMD